MIKLNKRLRTIFIISAIIILVASLEALFTAKSLEAYNGFLINSPNTSFGDFLNTVIIRYFFTIFEAIIIPLFLLITYKKLKPSKLYAIVFGGMIIIRIVNLVFSFNLGSLFYYLLIILYLVFLLLVINYQTKREDNR